jgi:hypothetical protein
MVEEFPFYNSILKMEAAALSRTIVSVYETTWCHIAGDK